MGADVKNHEWQQYTNFVYQSLVWPDSSVVVLLNLKVPIIGFCMPIELPGDRLEFLDNGRVATAFSEFDKYQITSKSDLNVPLKNEMTSDLGPIELKMVKYFGNNLRVGDVIFNAWD